MSNQFVRDTCMLIRHDAAAYHEDGWKRKAALTLGGLATVGGLAYANRDKLKQGASYVKRKAGSAYGAARQKAGQVYGKAKGMARNVYEQVATHPRNPF